VVFEKSFKEKVNRWTDEQRNGSDHYSLLEIDRLLLHNNIVPFFPEYVILYNNFIHYGLII